MIYLIGGASRSGKSVLARAFARVMNISPLSTDHVVSAFTKGVPEMHFDVDTSDDNRARKMWPFFRELINRTTHSRQSMVIEGAHLLPEMVNEITTANPDVRGCFLGFATSTPQKELQRVRAHPKYPGDWLAECTDDKAMYYLEQSIARSQRDQADCSNLNLTYFEITDDFEAAQTAATAFLKQGPIKHETRNTKH